MGNPLYCASCEFAASDIDDLERHIRARHAPAPVPAVPRNETRDEAWWRKTFDEYQANSEALIDDLRRQLLTLRGGVSSRVEPTEEEIDSLCDAFYPDGLTSRHSGYWISAKRWLTDFMAASRREPSVGDNASGLDTREGAAGTIITGTSANPSREPSEPVTVAAKLLARIYSITCGDETETDFDALGLIAKLTEEYDKGTESSGLPHERKGA